jgi:hypothetical protein
MAFYFNFIWLKPYLFITFSYPLAKAIGNSAKAIGNSAKVSPCLNCKKPTEPLN